MNRHRPAGRAATRLALAATVISGVIGVAAGAGAEVPPPLTVQIDDGTPRLVLAEQSFAIAPDAPWTARYVLAGALDEVPGITTTTTSTTTTTTAPPRRGAGGRADTRPTAAPTSIAPTEAPPRAILSIRAHGRLFDRLDLAIAETGDAGPVVDGVDIPFADVVSATDAGVELELSVPTTTAFPSPDTLTLQLPGIYPVTAELTVDGAVVARHVTFIDRLPEETVASPPMGVALVAAVDDPGPAASTEELATVRSQLDALATLGDAVEGPLTVALPPAAAAVAGDDGLASRLRGALAGSELLALPSPVLDPSAAVAIDATAAFSRALRDGEDVLAARVPDAPTTRAAWLVRAPLSGAAAAELRDPFGIRLLVLDDATYESLPGNIGDFHDPSLAVIVALPDGGQLAALVPSPLSLAPAAETTTLSPAAGTTTLSPADAAVHMIATLVMTRRELGPELRRNVVIAAPDFAVPDPATAAAFAALVTASPDVDLTTLSRVASTTDSMLVDGVPVTVELTAAAGVDLTLRAERIRLLEVAAAAVGSMLPDTDRRGEWLDRLRTLLSTGYDEAAATAELDAITAEIAAVRDSVEPPGPFTFTLTGRSSTLRLNLRNTASEDRIVVVRAGSAKLRFPDGDTLVTLAPGVTEVALPVEARANGTSSVEVRLLTPVFEQPIAPPAFLTARVNALTGLGQVITGAAGVILATWWFSHLRQRRRRRRAAAVDEDETGPVPDVSPDAAEATARSDDWEATGSVSDR